MNDTWWVNSKDLDSDQRAIITVPMKNHQLIFGPPGCGKTNLLLLKGTQCILEGKSNVLFLAYTRALMEFVASCPGRYKFHKDLVMTFKGWMMAFLSQEGVPFKLADKYDQDRRTLVRLCTEHIKARNYSKIFDAILVDEAQDCLPEEVRLFDKLAKILIVAQDNQQKIYSSESPSTAWNDIIPIEQRYELKSHYRNGVRICKLADEVMCLEHDLRLLPKSIYDESTFPSSVKMKQASTLKDQLDAMVANISTELLAYPGDTIGVFCSDRAILSSTIDHLKQSKILKFCHFHTNEKGSYEKFDSEKRVIVLTVYSGKGLEFRTGHFLSPEILSTYPQLRNILFTTITRVRTSLTLYHTSSLPPMLQSALNTLGPERKPVDLDELFG